MRQMTITHYHSKQSSQKPGFGMTTEQSRQKDMPVASNVVSPVEQPSHKPSFLVATEQLRQV